MPDGSITISTALDNKGFTRQVQGMKGELGGLTTVVKKLGAVIGIAFGVKAVVDFGKAAIELGSNVAEVQNVVDVAFGNMSYKIEDFARTSIQTFGMSRLATKKTASTYMAMARGMKMGEDAASDMAIALTGLSGDVASFFNISQELADTKLKSVFTGETETLKDLGVVMTQTNLKAYALSKGITKDIDKMTQAELVSLRYKFVMDQLSLAHGDFARTSDSWANQTRILSMQWQELKSIIGQTLIVVLKPLVKTLNDIVASMIQVATAVNEVVTTLFGGTRQEIQQTEENAEGVGGAIGDSVTEQDNLTDAVEATGKAQEKALASFDELNKLVTNTAEESAATPEPDVPSAGGNKGETTEQAVTGLSQKLQAFLESVRQGLSEITESVRNIWSVFAKAWAESGQRVIDAAKAALNSIWELIKSLGASFEAVWTSGSGSTILATIYSIITNIIGVVQTLTERFRIAWEANGNGEAIWRSILGIIQLVLNFVNRLVASTKAWASNLNLEPIVSSFRRLLEAITPLVSIILDGLAWAYENVLLPLAKWVIEEAAPAAIDLLSAAIDALTPVIEALKPFASWLWENFLKPLGQWTGEAIISAIEWLTDKLTTFSNWAANNKDVIQDVAIAVATLFEIFLAYKIADSIPKIVKAFDAFADSLALANPKITIAALAIGALVFSISQIVRAWDNMSGFEKAISVLSALGIAAIAAAIAVGAFQSAATLGLAAAGIVAGVLAITAAVNSAQARASSMGGRLSASSAAGRMGTLPAEPALAARASYSIPHLARGAVIPPNREFLAVLGDQKSGTNVEAPEGLIRQIIREEMGSMRVVVENHVNFEGDLAQMGRVLHPVIKSEAKRAGDSLVTIGSY